MRKEHYGGQMHVCEVWICTHICLCVGKHACWAKQLPNTHACMTVCKCVALDKSSVVWRHFSCTSVMSTHGADLDDKRDILPCWVGHLEDSHFFWRPRGGKYDGGGRTDREDAEKYVCERKNMSSHCRQSNREENYSDFIHVIHKHTEHICSCKTPQT